MSAWTPGPWFRCGPENDSKSGWFVEVAPKRAISVEGRTAAEAEANAHLIAAAPDLYEALLEARKTVQCLVDEGYAGYAGQRARIDAALAKARGDL